jgi:uncharacterized protein (DUF2062 family)
MADQGWQVTEAKSGDGRRANNGRNGGWLTRFVRVLRYRLHIPMIRSPHSPEYTARGVMVGIFWAMLPLVGIQMVFVLATWVIGRKVFNWEFSLVNGLAWTWITNVLTLIPAYYLFYVTGLWMMGNSAALGDYDSFAAGLRDIGGDEPGFWRNVAAWSKMLLIGWGLPMSIGAIPWAVSSAAISYFVSLRFVRAYKARRTVRMGK